MSKSNTSSTNRRAASVVSGHSFTISEAYKTLRTNLYFALAKPNECKKVLVCSPMSSEGKSTTAVNLAVTIAQTSSKVIILGCDLRKPRVHKFFEIENNIGMSDILGGMAQVEDCITKTNYPNLDIITAGTLPPNPAELLASDMVTTIFAKLSTIYDYIIIDTPPINIVSDALSLISKTDGVIMVVKQSVTTHPELRTALESLEFAGAKILGTVLNGVDITSNAGYKGIYKYKRSYHSKYGKKFFNYSYGNRDCMDNLYNSNLTSTVADYKDKPYTISVEENDEHKVAK